MNKAVLAYGLAGFAAATAISIGAEAPDAPAAKTRTANTQCSLRSHLAQVIRHRKSVKINRRRMSGKRAYLKRRDLVEVGSRNEATVCLRPGGTRCELRAGTELRVVPEPLVLGVLSDGGMTCKTDAGADIPFNIGAGAQTIKLSALGLKTTALLAVTSAAANADEGHLLSISVRRGGTTVKVRRGVTVVSRREQLENAVVLGRQTQVIARAAADPSTPTKIRLTPKESKVFAELQRLLPPLQDKQPPRTGLDKAPANPSSTRTPRFAFASEPGAAFSCAIDSGPFRLCLSSHRFESLAPGPHRLHVRATDANGNIGPGVRFDWTIDASMIAFTREPRVGERDIYVMDPDGRSQKPLTDAPGQDSAPAWSPDGKRIAFHSERDGNFELYVMNADGSEQTRLTRSSSFDLNPTWSPDGRRIAFESARDGNSELYVINVDGSGTRRLTNDPAVDFDPAWSPDGTRIAFASERRGGNKDIYVMDAGGSDPTVLAPHPAVEFNPAWSPDSRRIAFHSDREDGVAQIYIMDADGSTRPDRLTRLKTTDQNPVWSPDGLTIAFQSSPRGQDEIYTINVDGSDLTQLTDHPDADIIPDW